MMFGGLRPPPGGVTALPRAAKQTARRSGGGLGLQAARRSASGLRSGLLGLVLFAPATALALPSAPGTFCETYPSAPTCSAGAPACTYCHTAPPERNAYGAMVAAQLLAGQPRPLSPAAFTAGLPEALAAVADQDADGDGATNVAEINGGTLPADATSRPRDGDCDPDAVNPDYDVCGYDFAYAFKKMNLDFCGRSPTWEELQAFMASSDRRAAMHTALDACLDSEFWIGKDGQVWELAHPKVRPLQAIKAGPGAGPVPLADYDHDYNLFVWTQVDGHDARDLLLATYFVDRNGSTYSQTMTQGGNGTDRQEVEEARRAGMLTTRWNLIFNTMFTAVPRLTAAQAFRSYLGLDIAKLDGLRPVDGEPRDYDDKGVAAADCAVCHSTLDPLSYPFKNYQGLTGRVGAYQANRIERNFRSVAPTITDMPESGWIFGQQVNDLREWATVAANSEAFAANTVRDYWELLLGEAPDGEEQAIFQTLWQDFSGRHSYSVEAMLHDLVDTEAYGVP